MSLKLTALLEMLDNFQYEREVLKGVISGLHFPILLKLAQEQLVLPTEQPEDEFNKPPHNDEMWFSFDKFIGLYGFSGEEAEFMNDVLDRLCEEYPSKHRGILGEELRKEFGIGEAPKRQWDWQARQNEEKSKEHRIRKYLDMFPDLKWSPGFQQQQLPFEGVPKSIQLGGTPTEVDHFMMERRKIADLKNTILSKPEYASLKGVVPYRYGEKWQEYSDLLSRFRKELKDLVVQNGIAWEEEYAEIEQEEQEIDKPIVKSVVDKKKKDLEDRWHNLKRMHSVLLSELAAITPGEFTPKDSSEIRSFKESLAAVTEYLSHVIKKFAIERISFRPFAAQGYHNHSNNLHVGLDISDLNKLLEENIMNKDKLSPNYDYNVKSSSISMEEDYNEHTRKSINAWRKFIKHFDNNISIGIAKVLADVEPESMKMIRWIEKYRPDIIREIYNRNIRRVASNDSAEAAKFGGFPAGSGGPEEKMLDLTERLFGYNLNQKKVMQRLVADVVFQLKSIGLVVMDDILKKVRAALFLKAKKNFEDKYFQYGIDIDNLTYEQRSNKKYEQAPFEKIMQFIQDYNGSPNLKSFMSVIQNVTKDPQLAENFVKMQLASGNSYSDTGNRDITNMLFSPSEFNSKILGFVQKSKTSSVEEMIANAEIDLLPELEQLMTKSVAKALMFHLSNIDYKFGSTYNQTVKATSSGWNAIAPAFAGQEFKRWAGFGSSYDEQNGISSSLGKIKVKLRYELATELSKNSMNPEGYDKVDKIFKGLGNADANFAMINSVAEEMKSIFVKPPKVIFDETKDILQSPPAIGSRCQFIKKAGFWRQIEAMSIPQDIDFDGVYLVKDIKMHDKNCVIDIAGQEVLMPMEYLNSVSPSLDDYYNIMTKLIESDRVRLTGNKQLAPESMKELFVELGEFGMEQDIQTINSKYGSWWYEKIAEIFARVSAARFGSDLLPKMVLDATSDLKKIDNVSKFILSTNAVAQPLGGVGFRDISATINKLFDNAGIAGVSKKEFVQKILGFVTYGLQDAEIDPVDKVIIEGFLSSIMYFDAIIAPILKYVGAKDTKLIMTIATNVMNFKRNNNLDIEDLKKAIKTLPVGNLEPLIAVDRLVRSAAFIHNHSKIPTNYVRTLVNSPNFYSDTTISKEFIETCTKLYSSEGGIAAMKDEKTKTGKLIRQLIDSKLIADETFFYKTLNSFSRLCANKDGIRPNLGNPTAEMKLDEFVAKEFSHENPIENWDKFDLSGKIASLRKKYIELFASNKDPDDSLKWADEIANSAELNKFDAAIKKILETASNPEQYAKDIKMKAIIQTAAASMKLIEESSVMIKYAKNAKKKDARLLNLNYDDPGGKFRFRTLKDLDPYHFNVGSDTGCCQRIGGVGENAAIDSFINPLAGVLLLEGMIDGEWKIVAQSYFHFVPKDNGIILDNVETNHGNKITLAAKTSLDMNDLYAAFARYIVNTNNIEYVRCGKGYNKLNNSKFVGASLKGDPRHFEGSKYTDFKPGSHIDLLKPKVKPSIEFAWKKKEVQNKSVVARLVTLMSKMGLDEEVRSLEVLHAI